MKRIGTRPRPKVQKTAGHSPAGSLPKKVSRLQSPGVVEYHSASWPAIQRSLGNRAVQGLLSQRTGQALQRDAAEATAIEFTDEEALDLRPESLTEGEVQSAIEYSNRRGYSRSLIKRIQRAVGARDDGAIGPKTVQAVARWQASHGLKPDGKIGPRTLAAISKGVTQERSTEIGEEQEKADTEGRELERLYLVQRKGVVVTTEIQEVLGLLEHYFRRARVRAYITSAVRTQERQLSIIVRNAKRRGLHRKYPSILNATVDDIGSWRAAWDELLNVKNFIVNPPRPAVCRLPPRKGRRIGVSPHVPPRKAFDLAGAPLLSIAAIVKKCKREHPGLIGQILIERKNGCVHVGLK